MIIIGAIDSYEYNVQLNAYRTTIHKDAIKAKTHN